MINDECQGKLQDTMQKIVNDSNGGIVLHHYLNRIRWACTEKVEKLGERTGPFVVYLNLLEKEGDADMIMITGGSFQGKTEYRQSPLPGPGERIVHFEEQILQCIRENRDPQQRTPGSVIEQSPGCGCSDG